MTQALGRFGESYAVGFLSRRGYRILERNVRYREGELDIVAEEGGDLVFVEVKCRRSAQFGPPESSITSRRYEHLARAVDQYLSRHDLADQACRIDLVSIEVDHGGRVSRCDLLQHLEPPV